MASDTSVCVGESGVCRRRISPCGLLALISTAQMGDQEDSDPNHSVIEEWIFDCKFSNRFYRNNRHRCMHVCIYGISQVECLSVDKIFVFRLCLHF